MLAALIIALTVLLPAAQAATTAPVKIDQGVVTGVVVDGVESFKGIPFAAPPVGNLRWRAPQPAAAWKGVKTAEKYGAACMQKDRPGSIPGSPERMSEDCLTINLFRPQGAAKKLPVMVWIFGGGMINGAGGLPLYDGSAFARGGIILVNFNYRLARLGLFAHPAITKEKADGGVVGNYALLDEIAALKWVQKNIAAFGGDPNNVTIFGNSAGAYSVLTLMTTPSARGLFQKAISESGYGRGPYVPLAQAEEEGVKLAESLGAKNADAKTLRALPADQIVAKFQGTGARFIHDGKTITRDLWETFRNNYEAPVPLLIGNNSQESARADTIRADIRELVPAENDPVLEKAYGGRDNFLSYIRSDTTFGEVTRGLARLHAANGHPTYLYVFGVVSAEAAAKGEGALHATEIHYVFDNLNAGPMPVNDPVVGVAKTMNNFWRTFAATGVPKVSWPKYDGKTVMEFTRDGAVATTDKRNTRLDALSQILGPKS